MKELLFDWRGLLLGLLFVGRIFSAQAQPLRLVSSLNPNISSDTAGGDSFSPVISQDGRYILFSSSANNLVTNTSGVAFPPLFPAALNVFLRDRAEGSTRLVSIAFDGTGGGNGDSFPVSISTNGRYALFESSAANIVVGDTNNANDVFIRDLVNNTTALMSIGTNGECAYGISRSSVITPDGRFVAFVSGATNLVANDTNDIPDIFVRDQQLGTTVLASVGAKNNPVVGSPMTSSSESPEISADGRYVAFFSTATNLVSQPTTNGEIYVRDLVGGTTLLASVMAPDIVQSVYGTDSCVSYNHTISDDGQYVVYQASSNASPSYSLRSGIILRYNLSNGMTDVVNTNALGSKWGFEADHRSLDVTPDGRYIAFLTNIALSSQKSAVCVWDAQGNTTTFASVDTNNLVPADGVCYWPQISDDGKFVSFFGNATGLASNTFGGFYLYVRDMHGSTTALVDSPLEISSLSSNGHIIAFSTTNPNLTANDSNRSYDVFAYDFGSGSNELVSARNASLPTLTLNGPSTFSGFSLSADARYVAFHSEADNVVSNDTNSCRDVYVHDTLLGTNVLVSVATNGSTGNSLSYDPSISDDGRYVAFTSSSSDLVAGDVNGVSDISCAICKMGQLFWPVKMPLLPVRETRRPIHRS